jgi:hypothetical protein
MLQIEDSDIVYVMKYFNRFLRYKAWDFFGEQPGDRGSFIYFDGCA